MKSRLVVLAVCSGVICGAGPLDGFFKGPGEEHSSRAALGDIERCLIENSSAAPLVYRQPDRPNVVTLIWENTFTKPSIPVARIELVQGPDAVTVRSWKDGSKIVGKLPQCF